MDDSKENNIDSSTILDSTSTSPDTDFIPEIQHPIRVLRNVPYLSSVTSPNPHLMDLYLPLHVYPATVVQDLLIMDPIKLLEQPHVASSDCRPTLVWLHGGAWHAGSHQQSNAMEVCKCFARAGYPVVSVNYRLCNIDHRMLQPLWFGFAAFSMVVATLSTTLERWIWILLLFYSLLQIILLQLKERNNPVRHPMPANDVASSLSWIQKFGTRLGMDTKQIVLIGHSAGGHLAAITVADEKILKRVQFPLHYIKGVIGISGVYSADEMRVWMASRLIGQGVFGMDINKWNSQFPAECIRNHTHPELIPPHLLLTSEKDFGLHTHGKIYRNALKKYKIPAHLENIRDTTHFSIVRFFPYHHFPIFKRIVSFIERVTN